MNDSRFNGEWSYAYSQAVNALEKLLETEGLDKVRRAAAEVLSRELRKQYPKKSGFKRSQGKTCISRFSNNPYQIKKPGEYSIVPPGGDHYSMWLKDGKPNTIVSQPYDLHWHKLKGLVDFCEQHGLEAKLDSSLSWHYPGCTTLIEITRKNDN